MPRLNKNLGNVPIRKCKHKGCNANGVAYCVFGGKEKGSPPMFYGYLCEKHFNLYHRRCTAGQWA